MQGMESGSRAGFSAATTAAAFRAARLAARPLAEFPGVFPQSLSEAYAIQSHAIAGFPDSVAGWKVAGIRPEFADLGAKRLSGPAMLTKIWHVQTDGTVELPVFDGGFAAVEAEFVAVIARDIRPGENVTGDALNEAVASLHVGAESAGSPFAAINDRGPLAVISDFGNNNGVIVGPEIRGWRSRPLESLISRTLVNGAVVGEGSAANVAGGPLAAVGFLIENLGARGIALPKGTVISTGMTTGIHPVVAGDRITFEFVDDIRFHALAVTARGGSPAS
jgi:2-keto-4-pentenoate hydratase